MSVDNKKIAKNTLLLYIRMMLLMAVSLYTSRVVLAALGVDDFGIFNLIGGFIMMFSFISTSLVTAMQRYFNVCLGKNNTSEYTKVYSMGINIFALLSLCLLIIGETIGLWFITTQLNIPPGREDAAFWVYQVSLVTLVVTLFRIPDNASIIAHEKMEFYAYISILEALLKLAIVFFLGIIAVDKLILYVLLYLAASVFINIVYYLYCHKKIQDCRYVLIWDKRLFKSLVSFSGWNIFSGGTRVLKSQGDAYFLNYYYSVAVNAAFGVASQVYNAVNLFLTNFQTAFKPQLVQSYAAGEMEAHYKLINRSARLSYYLLLLIVVPVIFNLDGLLGMWLKEVPLYTKEFCFFVLLAYLVDALGAPLAVSVYANGNIKGLQIVISLLSVAGLIAGFLFLRGGALPYVISIIIFFSHLGFFIADIYFARKYTKAKISRFSKEAVLPAVLVSLLSVTIPYLFSYVSTSKWGVLLVLVSDFIWVAAIIYLVGLEKEERTFILKKIQR